MKLRAKYIVLLCCMFWGLAACGVSSTPVSEILQKPRAYEGKQVTISGNVVETFSLVVLKYFMVRDATGEIAVVTQRPLPKKGEHIEVQGRVQEAFSIGDQQLIVIVEDSAKR